MLELLDKINFPNDLKKLNTNELLQLTKEIRQFLISELSKTGGHLASNLGTVELTVGMHYCFEVPYDKFVWDVGHQSYTHKILTGRREQFSTLRKYKGLSGFPSTDESIYDSFDTGHSSTSISVALGFAYAMQMQNSSNHAIAVIGDGSLTGGLAYEALNNAGRSDTNLIVILNDNQMSISKNVGAVSKHLTEIRTTPTYLSAKNEIKSLLQKVPKVGDSLTKILDTTKNTLKHLVLNGIMFEEMGFKYIGPVDGHNLPELIKVFGKIKKMSGPILIHTYTTKGKGFLPAEKRPSLYHGVGKYDANTGKITKSNKKTYTDVFADEIVKIGNENNKVVAISAAMIQGTGLSKFGKNYPDRIFDVGIAESHAVTFAAALAKEKLIPVVTVYSTFLQRAFDQIMHDAAIQNLHVVFAVDRAGVVGQDGKTHQGLYDLSYLSLIPNITICSPKDEAEFRKMLRFAINHNGPIAIRYPKSDVPPKCQINKPIELGKSEILIKGTDIAVIALGSMVEICKSAVKDLQASGLNPTLINARFASPIDKDMIAKISQTHKYIFTAEENILTGGFGSKVLEVLSNIPEPKSQITCFAFPNVFVEHGSREEILAQYRMDSTSLATKIKEIINIQYQ